MKKSKTKRQTMRRVMMQGLRDIQEELLDVKQKVDRFAQNLGRLNGTVPKTNGDPKPNGKLSFASRADCVRVGIMFERPFTAKQFEAALKDNGYSYARFQLGGKTHSVKTPTDAIRTRLYKDPVFKKVGRGLFAVDRKKVLLVGLASAN